MVMLMVLLSSCWMFNVEVEVNRFLMYEHVSGDVDGKRGCCNGWCC